MSKEIEEIEEWLKVHREWMPIKYLLSSLEKEKQAHTMSVYDKSMRIAELGIALEKEKEKVRLIQEHADKLGEIITEQNNKRLELEAKIIELDDRIEKLVILIDGYAERINKAEERVKELESKEIALKVVIDKFKKGSEGMGIAFTDAMNHEEQLEERIKELEELITIQNDTITNSEKRINEAEALLVSIKADSSIGKLEVEDGFGEDD